MARSRCLAPSFCFLIAKFNLFRADMRIADKYRLIKKVGSGAFGEIYKGKSPVEHYN